MGAGWRIVPVERAADAFVGEGAKLFGGRWNSPGIAVVYGSQHKSLAALEQLVHRNPRAPDRFNAFRFHFPDALIETLPSRSLPDDWRQQPLPLSTQQLGDAWVREARSAILAVPSIIIPEEFNYLINPAHPDFREITVGKPEAFVFDTRLLT